MDITEIRNVGQLIYAENGGVVNIYPANRELPLIRERIVPPCNPYIDGSKRSTDLNNIDDLLKQQGKVLWVYGEGGIGKTELLCRFAELHPEYEYVFVKFKGSINQTISQNLFFLPGYEMAGMELTDVVRYQQNLSALTLYHHKLKQENRNLVLVIDNYVSANYEKTFREMTELDIDNKLSGEKNDLNTIQVLLRTGILVVITTRTIPEHSDAYLLYEVREMDESDLFNVMTAHFKRINPFLETPGVKEKLYKIIKTANSNTVFITIMALAMQSSSLSPIESLDSMIKQHGTDYAYHVRYAGKSARLQDHMEKILKFMGLSYQDKQLLGMLTMLPDGGIDYDLYQKLTVSGAVQLDQKREKILERFVNNHIAILKQKEGAEGFEKRINYIYMKPLVSEHARQVLFDSDTKFFLNLIEQNWINKLLIFFNQENLTRIDYQNKDYKFLLPIADVCSSTESKLRILGENLDNQSKIKINDIRRRLLFKAAELSDKTGNVKDALEYIERLINVEGPSSEDLETLRHISTVIGSILYEGGFYIESRNYYRIAQQILNDRNCIGSENEKNDAILANSDDASNYAGLFNSLALTYKRQKDYKTALEYYMSALNINVKVNGKEDRLTGILYDNIANIYDAINLHKIALKYRFDALSIFSNVHKKDNKHIAEIYNNIANTYNAMGNYEKALRYYEKSLDIIEKVMGKRNPFTAILYDNIACVYFAQKQYELALKHRIISLDVLESLLGNEHPETAITYHNIALTYRELGNNEKELEFENKYIEIQKKHIRNC